MMNIRNLGLTALALGLIATPVAAETLGGSTQMNADTTANVDTPVNKDTTSGADLDAQSSVETETMANYDFDNYDQNEDGLVTEAEFASNMDENLSLNLFAEYDTDANGALNEAEFEELARNEHTIDTETDTESNTY